MKKLLGFLFVVLAVSMLSVSCRKEVRGGVSGIIDELNDSVMVARTADGKVIFDIRNANYTNGAVMYGDSVVIVYVGDLSEKRAVAEVIKLIPKPSPVVTDVVDTTKVLMTRDADPEAIEAVDRMIKAAQTHKIAK
jgi:hypothetical protein